MIHRNNCILSITILYITLLVKSVQITDTSLYIKWNGQSHQKNICININNLLQFFLTPLTLNYSDIAKQSNM